ncbi:uncharacterized protein LOC119932275 isoform X4 [Tachyglossus aculeatus]|uniref:uncharacterized protein LOC119932275 isoform X4 n=1 Tax=Tachyglossus aculeatus TaxID=9261 RepID=UPI0018F37ACC|nr:uncharacterized protein LOC119932275 isoform X4 [Tachyglossus aculeatus]XP_038607298.1 uncharacterized protein LOC119932275 isoform X4 [Tachyglossus aculeatus]
MALHDPQPERCLVASWQPTLSVGYPAGRERFVVPQPSSGPPDGAGGNVATVGRSRSPKVPKRQSVHLCWTPQSERLQFLQIPRPASSDLLTVTWKIKDPKATFF